MASICLFIVLLLLRFSLCLEQVDEPMPDPICKVIGTPSDFTQNFRAPYQKSIDLFLNNGPFLDTSCTQASADLDMNKVGFGWQRVLGPDGDLRINPYWEAFGQILCIDQTLV